MSSFTSLCIQKEALFSPQRSGETPGEEALSSIPAVAARSLLIVTGYDRSHDLPTLSRVWQHVKWSEASLRTRPRYSLVVDEDVRIPIDQGNTPPEVSMIIFLK